MSKKRKRIAFIVVTLVIGAAIGVCFFGDITGKRGRVGLITYKVEYPYYDGTMINIMPDEMLLYYKDGRYVTEMSSGGFFLNKFIVDNNNYELKHQVKSIGVKTTTTMNLEQTDTMIKKFPSFDLIHTGETDSVAGFLCYKAIGIFHDVSFPDMTIYYTTDSTAIPGMEHSNWWGSFRDIPGTLMRYEIEQFGLRTRFTAVSHEKAEVSDEVFTVPEDYQVMDNEEMFEAVSILFETI